MLIRLYDLKKQGDNSLNYKDETIAEFEVAHPGQAPQVATYEGVTYSYVGTQREDPPLSGGEVKVWQKYRPATAIALDAGSKIVND